MSPAFHTSSMKRVSMSLTSLLSDLVIRWP
jgi:hypothetical protein